MFDPKALIQTTKITANTDDTPTIILLKYGKNGAKTEMWRFILPPDESSEEWSNNFNQVSPYKKQSLIDFIGRSPDRFSIPKALITTRSQQRSVQPLLDKLKLCMIPAFDVNNRTADQVRDDFDPPELSLNWGNMLYSGLYLEKVGINITRRSEGNPTVATVSLSFVSSYINSRFSKTS